MSAPGNRLRPADHQPALPAQRLISSDKPGDEAVPLDVLEANIGRWLGERRAMTAEASALGGAL